MSIEQIRLISEKIAHNMHELNRKTASIQRDPDLLTLEKQDAIVTAKREAKEREDELRKELNDAQRTADAERQLGAAKIVEEKRKDSRYRL